LHASYPGPVWLIRLIYTIDIIYAET
jgi:hypothetical protein